MKLRDLTLLFLAEPAEVYHAKADQWLSSHRLADFRRCPLLYHRKLCGLVADEDRPAYLLGCAAHTLILEGQEKFQREYAIGGPVNPKTHQPYGAATKAFTQWAQKQGKPALSHEQALLCQQMAKGARSHGLARELLSVGIAEGVVRTTWGGIECQIRLDFFSQMPGAGIVDLKTTEDLGWFEADARRYGYPHQLAFYRSVLAAAGGRDPLEVPVHLIAVEKKEPFRAGVWRMGENVLAIAQKENQEAVRCLRRCQELGHWPTGYEQLRTFDWI